MENYKDKRKVYENRFWVWRSVTRREDVSTYNARHKKIPLINIQMDVLFYAYFSQK